MTQPLADDPALDNLGAQLRVNVSDRERVISGLLGAALLLGTRRHVSLTGLLRMALGAALLFRGASGHCSLYYYLGKSTRPSSHEPA